MAPEKVNNDEPQPHFLRPVTTAITNYKTNENCPLEAIDLMQPLSERDLQTIADICNEERLYSRFFSERLAGQPYTVEHAREFAQRCYQGWEESALFAFVIRDRNQKIVAMVDIKSGDLNGAEIGYWASQYSPGVVTNAVTKVAEIAREAGFRRLTALVDPVNQASYRVLERAGFSFEGMIQNKNNKLRKKYALNLAAEAGNEPGS